MNKTTCKSPCFCQTLLSLINHKAINTVAFSKFFALDFSPSAKHERPVDTLLSQTLRTQILKFLGFFLTLSLVHQLKVKLLRDCQHIYNIWLQYSDDRARIVGAKQPNDFKEFFFQLVVTTHPHMQSHSKHEVSLLLKWIIFLWSKMLCPFKRILMALKWIVEQRPNCGWF